MWRGSQASGGGDTTGDMLDAESVTGTEVTEAATSSEGDRASEVERCMGRTFVERDEREQHGDIFYRFYSGETELEIFHIFFIEKLPGKNGTERGWITCSIHGKRANTTGQI